jgi:signal transduction histidine kinase
MPFGSLGHGARERVILAAAAVGAATAAALDGGLAAANPHAQPPHLAVAVRVAVILLLLAAALFARTDRLHARMGLVLLATVPFAALWLMTGSKLSVPFTIGVLFTSASPALFSYLLLAHPTGRLQSRTERALLWLAGSALVIAWSLFAFTHRNPPLETPLLKCGPYCPRKAIELDGLAGAGPALRAVFICAWLALSLGTLALLARRFARANPPVRRVMGPVVAIAAAAALLATGVVAAHAAGDSRVGALGAVYLGVALATPVGILLGLLLERMYMGRSLADLLDRLTADGAADVESVMAGALHDPTLSVVYATGTSTGFVDGQGVPVALPDNDERRAAVLIEQGGEPAAAVLFDAQLAEQERYVQAAGEAALMWLAKDRLESDRAISRIELAVSRRRVQEAAEKERRRIQRDLHDGAQQRLLAMSAKVSGLLALDGADAARQGALADIQQELGETLQEVRTLAEGVYPPLLTEYGLARALRAVSRGLDGRIAIAEETVGRYDPAVEGAVYFTCLEAMQNAIKHGGGEATVRVRLWRAEGSLLFMVADDGRGFTPSEFDGSSGLVHMNDRIAALGGTLRIGSVPGVGTRVSGRIPVVADGAWRASETVPGSLGDGRRA